MRHKGILASDAYRRYSFSEIFRFTGNSTPATPDPTKAYLAVVINYCTASGTSTTTDSVTADAPSITIDGQPLTAVYAIRLDDNTGDEGTGFSVSAFNIPPGTTSFVVEGQTVEDQYGTAVLLFRDDGVEAGSGAFSLRVLSEINGTLSDVPTVVTANSNFLYWGIHANSINQLSSTYPDLQLNPWSTTMNIVLAFYHAYGTSAIDSPVFEMEDDNNDPTSPVYEYRGAGNVFGTEGQNAIAVYNGVDLRRQSRLLVTPSTNAGQGDQVVILQF
jgi:hypothetical protein